MFTCISKSTKCLTLHSFFTLLFHNTFTEHSICNSFSPFVCCLLTEMVGFGASARLRLNSSPPTHGNTYTHTIIRAYCIPSSASYPLLSFSLSLSLSLSAIFLSHSPSLPRSARLLFASSHSTNSNQYEPFHSRACLNTLTIIHNVAQKAESV